MEDRRHLLDVLVEQAERRGVGEHETGRALVDLRPQIVEVEVPAVVRLCLLNLEARHRHAGGVRAVRRVGGDDDAPLVRLASIGEVRAHEHEAGQLTL